jgi:hypothetical protein
LPAAIFTDAAVVALVELAGALVLEPEAELEVELELAPVPAVGSTCWTNGSLPAKWLKE